MFRKVVIVDFGRFVAFCFKNLEFMYSRKLGFEDFYESHAMLLHTKITVFIARAVSLRPILYFFILLSFDFHLHSATYIAAPLFN